jgi:hypothetical protein
LELKFSYDYRITEDTNAAFLLRDVVYPRGAGFLGWIALALSPIGGCTRRGVSRHRCRFSILLAILIVGVSVWIGYLLFDVAHRVSAKRVAGPTGEGADGGCRSVSLRRRPTSQRETLLRWRAFRSAFEKHGCVYMVISGSALVVPARAFLSADARRGAMIWIHVHMTPEAQTRSANLRPQAVGYRSVLFRSAGRMAFEQSPGDARGEQKPGAGAKCRVKCAGIGADDPDGVSGKQQR